MSWPPRLVGPGVLGLCTDLYQLTMVQAYLAEGMTASATFELSIRSLPSERNYLLACGCGAACELLELMRFDDDSLDALASLDRFSDELLAYLRSFRFSGEVRAMPDGTPAFPGEPVLAVTAPLPEAQIVESLILSVVSYETMAASKAARVVDAAGGRPVMDFGLRRAHGLDAAYRASRAAYLGGAAGTSNMLGGVAHEIPVSGTMAHSYIESHESEAAAFEAFVRMYPDTVLLVDTYDTLHGVRRVIELAERMGEDFRISAVRLDSGDLEALSREARRMLDEAGLSGVGIFVSGGLDEYVIDRLVRSGAPVDGFGVGTSLVVSDDAPTLEAAYKLVEYDGQPRMKLSSGKRSLPGRKQVFRSGEGEAAYDVIAMEDESPGGVPLLETFMRGGVPTEAVAAPLEARRAEARAAVERLPGRLRGLEAADPPYRVEISDRLRRETERLEAVLRD